MRLASSCNLSRALRFGHHNEATSFVVTSRKMAGKELDEGSPDWAKAVKRGDMLPLTLIQDDPFVIRVVAGESLNAQESEEWVARVDWHLNIPDGKLCVTGGAIFTNSDYDPDDDYLRTVRGRSGDSQRPLQGRALYAIAWGKWQWRVGSPGRRP